MSANSERNQGSEDVLSVADEAGHRAHRPQSRTWVLEKEVADPSKSIGVTVEGEQRASRSRRDSGNQEVAARVACLSAMPCCGEDGSGGST